MLPHPPSVANAKEKSTLKDDLVHENKPKMTVLFLIGGTNKVVHGSGGVAPWIRKKSPT